MICCRQIAILCLLMARVPGAASSEEGSASQALGHEIRPLLARYCLGCHGDQEPKASLKLSEVRQVQNGAFLTPHLWSRVRDRLRSKEMPPANQPQPSAEQRKRLVDWIDAGLARHTIDGQPDPGPLFPRRLNVREHRNMFRDLAITKDRPQPRRAKYETKKDGTVNLYHAVVPPAEHPCDFVTRVLPQDTQDGGFDAIAENLSIPPYLMARYFRASRLLLDDCFSIKGRDQHGRYQWRLRELLDKAGQGPLPRTVRTRREALVFFFAEFASRAFRRPVSTDEADRYVRLFESHQEAGASFESSMRTALQAILVSPRFVILWADDAEVRTEPSETIPEATTSNDAGPAGVRPLDDFELATRLALFLWSSVPDRELRELAGQGKLRDDQVLEQQIRRMLQDRRVTDGFHSGLLCQWLQLDTLDRSAPAAELFPDYFHNNLAELMKQEVLLFTDIMLVEDRSILEFLDADWGILCQPLAEHYGVEDFPGKKQRTNAAPPWYRVKFPDRTRGGVLTMGKVLTGTSQPTRTSPVHRGKWVLETILGAPPPPPPPDVDNLLKQHPDDSQVALTVPQMLAKHRASAACAACHDRIDPLGVAFENFDPVGSWREKDGPHDVQTRSVLVDGTQLDGIVELKTRLLSRRDEFVRCFSEQMLAYALGRKLEFYDEPTVDRITQAVISDDCRLSRVVVEVALSYPFRNRRTHSPRTIEGAGTP